MKRYLFSLIALLWLGFPALAQVPPTTKLCFGNPCVAVTSSTPLPVTGGGGGGGTVTQGPAAAITGGWPVIDGAGTDTTGTLTSGAGTVNATIDGYASIKVQFKGTYAGFTFTTNVSSDGGTTFVPIQCALVDGSQFGTSFILTANQSTELACGHQSGDDTFQIATASGPATGTANVDISPSAFPSDDGQTVAIGKSIPEGSPTDAVCATPATATACSLIAIAKAINNNVSSSIPAGTNAIGSITNTSFGVTGTVAVTGTFFQATQPVSNAGTFAVQNTAATPAGTNSIGSVNGASNVALTDCSGTVTTGGTAVNAFTAQTTLHGFTIVNTNTAEVMWISFTTTAAASTAGSYPIPAATATTFAGGGSFTSPPGMGTNHALSVIAATTAHSFSCTWW